VGNRLPLRSRAIGRAPIRRTSGSVQLRFEAHGLLPTSRSAAALARPRATLRTILAFRFRMPRDEVQGLCFLLGLLLAFYFLTPFLELAPR
jgi:hypothetical protein